MGRSLRLLASLLLIAFLAGPDATLAQGPEGRTEQPMEELRECREAELHARMEERWQDLRAQIQSEATPPAAAAVNKQDSLALVALYNATDGDNWEESGGWLEAPMPDWQGVSVGGERVIEVSLASNGLTGELPPDLSQLDSLRILNLSGNELTGPIPEEPGQLQKLQILFLHRNQLTGEIPPELDQLASLHWLRLSRNNLTGAIPPELGRIRTLQSLDLDYNQLAGPIPPELGQLDSLLGLDLTSNELTGPIPPALGNPVDLIELGLFGNPLSGPIPLALTKLTALIAFTFNKTNLCEPQDADFQAWLSGVSAASSGESCTARGAVTIAADVAGLYVLGMAGAAVAVKEAGGGPLRFARQDTTPPNSTFQGSATAPDGSAVAPNATAGRYWSLSSDSLTGVSYRLRLDTAGVDGIRDPDKLLILHRPDSTAAWTPLSTTWDDSVLVSEELSSFGEFTIGTDAEVNPIPTAGRPKLPDAFALRGNAPNPFHGKTTIRYDLPEPRRVRLAVYDALGRKVRTLVNRRRPAGRHQVRFAASDLPSGIYFCRLTAGDRTRTGRMVLVR